MTPAPSMPAATLPTLVMGARGSVGRHVLDLVLAAGLPVRASMRRPAPGALPDGVEVVAADLTDPASLHTAFAGVGQVFLYAHREGVHGVIEAARAHGVRRVVLMSSGSVIHATSAGNAITEEHRAVEDAFAAAEDLVVVPVRPLFLATNALGWSHAIRRTASIALYQPEAVTAPIHERDVAAVAVAALTGQGSAPVSGMLTGPTQLSQRQQVAVIASALDQQIAVEELSRSDAVAQYTRFTSAEEAEAIVAFLDDAAAGNSPATDTVQHVLGRPATSFREWAAEHAEDYR